MAVHWYIPISKEHLHFTLFFEQLIHRRRLLLVILFKKVFRRSISESLLSLRLQRILGDRELLREVRAVDAALV